MQYPIIDLITRAYINNGWTGLDISTGKNLYYGENIENVSWAYNAINDDIGRILNSLENGTYTISYDCTVTYVYPQFTSQTALAATGRMIPQPSNERNPGRQITREQALNGYSNRYTLTINKNNNYINLYLYGLGRDAFEEGAPNGPLGDAIFSNIQIEIGSEATPYEPYSEPKSDFPNRLKLPLPHYFPHPVIDALQRAAAGTQTADDTEILRHYLTPLGIGGI